MKFLLTSVMSFCVALCFASGDQDTLYNVNNAKNGHLLFSSLRSVTGDTLPVVIHLREVLVYPPLKFKNRKEEIEYTKLVRDVKKTLPYAKIVYSTLIETYEYIQTLPDEKTKNQHLKRMEKELFQEYKPELNKLTLSQGKLLLKLVDRECNQTSYALVTAFLGKFRAVFWNFFAGIFGASMKTEYDPHGKDAMTERVVQLVEHHQI
jgi:hypothetical protein